MESLYFCYFVVRYRYEYDAILFWRGGSDADMERSWSDLARQLGLKDGDPEPSELLKEWLQKLYIDNKPVRWLLLVDDATSTDVLAEIGSQTFDAGRTIICTRSVAVVEHLEIGNEEECLDLDPLKYAHTWEALATRGWPSRGRNIAGDRSNACRGLPAMIHLQADILDNRGDEALLLERIARQIQQSRS